MFGWTKLGELGTVNSSSTSSSSSSSSLLNLSTRGYVGTGDSVMIAGFVLSTQTTVTIRALGPTIGAAPFNVADVVANPKLTIYDGTGTAIATNDDYASSASVAAVTASGKANINASEPAVQLTLAAGNYSAIVEGVGGTTGNCIVEVYYEN